MPIYTTPSIVSSGNSTTSLLTAGSTFTGTWERVGQYNSITVAAKTDQDGTLVIEYSPDGSNVDSSLTRYYRTGQIEAPHRFTNARDYVRVKFTNTAASDQTFLRLQTLIGDKSELNAPLDSTLATDFDAVATRPTDFATEVALGRRQGASTWNKFAYNTDVGTSAEVVAAFGGTLDTSVTASTVSIVSSSSADDAGSTGMTAIVVYGVDSSWDELIEVVTMDGTTPVTTTGSFVGINRIAGYSNGAGGVNAGTITATATTGGRTMATVPAGEGVTQQAVFYVPQNHQFLATWLYLSVVKSSGGGNPDVTFKGWVYSAVSSGKYEIFRDEIDTSTEERINITAPEPFVVGEKSIMWFESTSSAGSTSVKCRFSGKLIKDVDA